MKKHCNLAYLLPGTKRASFQSFSNHQSATLLAEYYGVPFYYLPVTAETKPEVEAEQLELLARHTVDLIALARYMQAMSARFVAKCPRRIINVHSFLPTFTGAKPFRAAFADGVKLIGSTCHYLTESFDERPIIERDVTRISHRDQVEDLIQKGRELERVVFSRTVRWHLDRRILCYANKTVVFD